MVKLGIIGLPQSGKDTVFKTLVGNRQPTAGGNGRYEIRTAMVDVPDPRVDRLAAMFQPRKVTYAKVNYAAVKGLNGKREQSGFSGELLNHLSQMEGFVHVVDGFSQPFATPAAGSAGPEQDIAALDAELLLNDMIAVERKLERLGEELRRTGGRNGDQLRREAALFERLQASLAEETPLRDLSFSTEEEKVLSGYALLTRKPVLILLNIAEGDVPPGLSYPHRRSMVAHLHGRLEMELAQLAPDEAALFMTEYGLTEPGLEKVIRLSYELLGMQSFFTVGEDEVRAWTIPQGATALQAAGAIHSDLQKGFIRAEVISYADLVMLGGLPAARQNGKLRLEGKDYPVQDGDIVHIRFNV